MLYIHLLTKYFTAMRKITLKEARAIIKEKTGETDFTVMGLCIEDLRIALRLLKVDAEITIN